MMGTNIRNIVLLILGAFLVAGYFVGQVWKQDQYVALMKEQRRLNKDIFEINSDIVKLKMEHSQLKDFRRLETLGREKYGFVYSGIPSFVYPQGRQGGSREK